MKNYVSSNFVPKIWTAPGICRCGKIFTLDQNEGAQASEADRVEIHVLERAGELLQFRVPGAHYLIDQLLGVDHTAAAETNPVGSDGGITD